ncbi:hypothetical protein IGI04_035648 [Brassica rapa subsp. trilocularis]|uniref:Uncharacterized protein n=1 Tax=Brassica rapa subsp. trilocularis TaxID=1813537 RepID=A0ABQ7LFB2_BRACM|nr:hypothetical protein IGI04_035648 [Brassica rapa subsp. trilocularis]
MSGNTKDKIVVCNNAGKTTSAATAPMANAYANTTVLEKIKNLAFGSLPNKRNLNALRFYQNTFSEGKTRSPKTAEKTLATELKTTLHSLRSDRPQKGPPLGSHLNPHRNAFHFVSIGVSVEILRRKQVGLVLARFPSLRSDLLDLHSLHSDRSSFVFSFESRSKRFSFRLNRSFRRDFTTNTSKTRLNSFAISYSPLPPAFCPNATDTYLKPATDELEYGNRTTDKPSTIATQRTQRPRMHTARSLRSDQACTLLGRYVATKHQPSSSQAQSLRSDLVSVPLGRYIATECPSRSVAAYRPSVHHARSLCRDRALSPLGRYVATGLKLKLGRYVVTALFQNVDTTPVHALSSNLRCYLPKIVANSVHVFRYSKPSIKLCGLKPRKVRSLSKEVAVKPSSRKMAQRDLKHDSRPTI